VKRILDWLARRLTWDGKGVGNYRTIRLGPLGSIGFDHTRHPSRHHFPGCKPCWRPWHIRVYWSLARRWLRYRYGRCTICGGQWSWWETGARHWKSEAQSGSQWHKSCALEKWVLSLSKRVDDLEAKP